MKIIIQNNIYLRLVNAFSIMFVLMRKSDLRGKENLVGVY